MSFSEQLKKARLNMGYTQQQVADIIGITKSTYCGYETGKRKPDVFKIKQLATCLNTSGDILLETESLSNIPEGFEPMPEMATIPRIGQIACGTPILAQQNIECMGSAPKSWNATFSLVCKGDSMLPSIKDGDLVAIRQQPMVENGEIAAVRIGDEATLKRVYLKKSQIILQPENPEYEPIVLFGEEINDVKIIGKAVGLCRGL